MAIDGVGSSTPQGISEGDQGGSDVGQIDTLATDTELEHGPLDSPDLDAAANDADLAPVEEAPPPSPETAVREIWDVQTPTYTSLDGIPESASTAVYEQAVVSFNGQRADMAQAALDQFAPTPEMFDSLPPGPAAAALDAAVVEFESDPFVNELQAIVEQATTAPDALPTDPVQADPNGVFVSSLPDAQVLDAVRGLGIELPTHITGADIAAARELLDALPQDLRDLALSPGVAVNFTSQLSASTPGLIPVRVEGSAVAQFGAELGDVRTGAGLVDTQRLNLEVEVRTELGLTTNRTALQTAYHRYTQLSGLGLLSDGAAQLVQSSPLARALTRSAPVFGSIESFSGTRVSYEATVTAEQGARIAEGELAAPNPFDPLNMPQGTSVMIRGQELAGSSFEASYRGLATSSQVTQLEGTAFGVSRLEGDVVQVVSGPIEGVENSAFFGLGVNSANVGVGVDRSLEDQSLQFANIDLGTASGREAYSEFLSTGQVPASDGVGVLQSGEATALTYTHSAGAELTLGPLNLGGEFASANVSRVERTFDDGTVVYENVVQINGRTLQYDFVTDTDGNVISEATTYTIVHTGTSDTSASYAATAFDLDSGAVFDGAQDSQLTFSHEQMEQLRGLAMSEMERLHGDQGPEQLELRLASPGSFTERLAAAPTAEAAARLVFNTPAGFFETDLLSLAAGQEVSLPGGIEIRSAAD